LNNNVVHELKKKKEKRKKKKEKRKKTKDKKNFKHKLPIFE